MKSAHRMRNSNKLIKWTTTWCAKHQEQPLSSTCSILGLILKCTQIFEEETTHLTRQNIIPFHQWYQHHYYQLCHYCLKILDGEIPHIMMQCWLEARYQANEITKEMRGNQTTYHSGARLWRLAMKYQS